MNIIIYFLFITTHSINIIIKRYHRIKSSNKSNIRRYSLCNQRKLDPTARHPLFRQQAAERRVSLVQHRIRGRASYRTTRILADSDFLS
jgi:hypothetical protein